MLVAFHLYIIKCLSSLGYLLKHIGVVMASEHVSSRIKSKTMELAYNIKEYK